MTTTLSPAAGSADIPAVVHPVPGTDVPHPRENDAPVPAALVRAHTIAGLVLLLVAVTYGLVVATKFSAPEFLGDKAAFTWGRMRASHVQGILYAWLMNGFIAFAYFAAPTLTGRAVLSERLGWVLFWLWNVGVVVMGWVLVALGHVQSLEWGEFPIISDVIVLIAFSGFIAQFLTPYFRDRREGRKPLYVASWYLVLALSFTPVAFIIGQFLPEYFAPGAVGAILSGLWIHDAVGLLVTPMSLLIAYYVIPAATGRPIFSHFMSLVGFWGLVFFYPLNGIHHYVFSPIPMHTQSIAIAASAVMGLMVVIVVTNLLASLRGSARLVVTYLPLRFIWMSIIFYLLVSLQGAYQAGMPVQQVIHFSDWVIAHSHLAMAGFATFMVLGGLLHVWPLVSGRRPHEKLARASFWVSSLSLLMMVVDLTIVGLQQASLWLNGSPWIDSVTASMPGWLTRSVSGAFLTLGFILFLAALFAGEKQHDVGDTTTAAEAERGPIAEAREEADLNA